jgi:hypothetical protein
VQGVHSVGIDEPGKIRGAAYSTDGSHVVIGNLQLNQRLLHRRQHAEITTTRAPVGIDLAFEVGHGGQFWSRYICRHRCFS